MTDQVTIKRFILETLLNIVVILAVVIGVRVFLVTPFVVEGESMMDSYENGEYIIINKLSYRFWQPYRGDVVVFRPPIENVENYYIKRIIGLPGEKVRIENGLVYVCNAEHPECFELDESKYLNLENLGKTCVSAKSSTCPSPLAEEYEVPENAYFVLGDNRLHSCDSRAFGTKNSCGSTTVGKGTFYVPMENIEGKSWVSFWPLSKFGFMPSYGYDPDYNASVNAG